FLSLLLSNLCIFNPCISPSSSPHFASPSSYGLGWCRVLEAWHTKWTMNTTISSRSYSLETLVSENPISFPGLPGTSFAWSLSLRLGLNSQPEHYRWRGRL
ncbi:hypothetical protein VIGAN_04359100, partial [Vigna angularis var. angularis]